MKKLMIAAAIVCAAAMSQAAAFTWSTASKAYMPYAIGSLTVGKDQAAATSTNSKSMSNWADAGTKFTYEMYIDGTKSSGENLIVTYDARTIAVAANNDAFVLPTDDSQKTMNYSIVITGKYTDNDGNTWTMVSDTIAGSQNYTKSSAATLDTGVPTKWTITMKAPEPPEPTPEPTSALLMLVGVAGLALRRRRA